MRPQSPSEEQKAIASLLRLDISRDTFAVATARIHDSVAVAIGEKAPAPSSLRQQALAAALGLNVEQDSRRIASARIGDLLYIKNRQAIDTMRLRPGDRVTRVNHIELETERRTLEQEFTISSIQPNGRIYFKGGNGQGAWPSQIRRIRPQ